MNQQAQLEKLRRIRGRKPLAVVLGSTVAGLNIIRSLGCRKVPALQIANDTHEGMYTRYGKGYLLPPHKQCEAQWLGFLESVGKGLESPGVIFATSDKHLLFLSRNRKAIGKFFRFLIPDSDTVEQIVNKRTQYTAAEKAGIAIPKTWYPESLSDVRSWAADFSYPCILKPYTNEGRGVIGKKVVLAHSSAQLIEEYGRISESSHGFMIQEVIPGGSDASFAYHGFWDSEGRVIDFWTKRHLRGTPFGCSSLSTTVNVPEIADLSHRLLSAFKYRGFVNVQFMLDSRDNQYRLMEINARVGQAIQHGVTAGVDLPWIGYRHLIGESVTSSVCRSGVTYMDEKVDLALWRSGGIPLRSCIRSLIQSESRAYWAWKDPAPFLSLGWNAGRASLRSGLLRGFSRLRMTWILKTVASLFRMAGKPAQAERFSRLAWKVDRKDLAQREHPMTKSASTL